MTNMASMTTMTLGQRLKLLIKMNLMTQKEFAKIINLSENKLSKLCRNVQIPDANDLLKISKGLNLTVDQLLGKDKWLNEFINYYDLINLSYLKLKNILEISAIIDKDKKGAMHMYNVIGFDLKNKEIEYVVEGQIKRKSIKKF